MALKRADWFIHKKECLNREIRRCYDDAGPLELVHSRRHRHEAVSLVSSAVTSSSRSRASPGTPEKSTKAQTRAMTAATVAASRAAGIAAIVARTPPTSAASAVV